MFDGLSLKSRFSIAAVAFLLPLLCVTYLLSTEMGIRFKFGHQEIQGVRYLEPLQSLLYHAGEFRTAARLNQSTGNAANAIDATLATMEDFADTLTPELRTHEQIDNVINTWRSERSSSAGNTGEKLVSDVRALIARAGDTSNLILDPDLDTYYVMDALLLKLPNSLDLIWQIRSSGDLMMQKADIDMQDYANITVLTGLLQADVDAINYDSRVAYENNTAKDLPTAFADAVARYTQTTQALNSFISTHIAPGSLKDDRATLLSLSQSALKANLALYDQASPALLTMLERRIQGFANERYLLLGTVLAFTLLASFLSLRIFLGILQELGEEPAHTAAIMRTIAQGNLDVRIQTKDGDANSLLANVGLMVKTLNELILQVREASRHMLSYSGNVIDSSNEVANHSHHQSVATATISSAVHEIATGLNQMLSNAELVRNQSIESSQKAREGEQMVREILEQMEILCGFVNQSSQAVEALGQQSEQIYSIVNVIKSIAEQTNLLALNAAIEAARAGEQGRGFAVVADEVRNLAARTSNSTLEITGMIERIRNDTQGVVTEMAKGVSNANRSAGKISQAMDTISQLNRLSNNVNRSIVEITVALEQQAKANELLNENVVDINHMSEQNSDNAQRNLNNLRELNNLAAQLEQAINRFKLSA